MTKEKDTADVSGGSVKPLSFIVTPSGLGRITSIDYAKDRPIRATVRNRVVAFRLDEVRKATIADFMFNRDGFGRTSWPEFAAIQVLVCGLVVTGILTWDDSGWVAHAFALAVEGVLAYGTWGNFTGRIR